MCGAACLEADFFGAFLAGAFFFAGAFWAKAFWARTFRPGAFSAEAFFAWAFFAWAFWVAVFFAIGVPSTKRPDAASRTALSFVCARNRTGCLPPPYP